MSKAALDVSHTIKTDGTQTPCIDQMQTRAELYEHLNYMEYEQQLDRLHNSKHK
jgi:methylisocitrate lyase